VEGLLALGSVERVVPCAEDESLGDPPGQRVVQLVEPPSIDGDHSISHDLLALSELADRGAVEVDVDEEQARSRPSASEPKSPGTARTTSSTPFPAFSQRLLR